MDSIAKPTELDCHELRVQCGLKQLFGEFLPTCLLVACAEWKRGRAQGRQGGFMRCFIGLVKKASTEASSIGSQYSPFKRASPKPNKTRTSRAAGLRFDP